MLKLPGNLTPGDFLSAYWQRRPLFMPGALAKIHSAISRNELAWLATLDEVESRLVFVERAGGRLRYRAESGPFPVEYLQSLPKRDWTLLVHDVEKHLPALRVLFRCVPFIPDWRIDDIMVSFAAPGGGVGPHQDNYDVFLCQGIGIRDWRFTDECVDQDPDASDELSLLREFDGGQHCVATQGDILYIPPGAPHWGTARRACMTYSIGMRAPQLSDLGLSHRQSAADGDPFYRDPNLSADESMAGYISPAAAERVIAMAGVDINEVSVASAMLGEFATRLKEWLHPDDIADDDVAHLLSAFDAGKQLRVHGMSRIAFDDKRLYVNGDSTDLDVELRSFVDDICSQRRAVLRGNKIAAATDILRWMARRNAFEVTEHL